MSKLLLALAAVACAAPVLMSHAQATDPLMTRALRLLKEAPVIDGHNDYPWAVRDKGKLDVDLFDMRQPQPLLHTDFARLRAGGVGGQFWSVYVPGDIQKTSNISPVTATLEQIDIVHRMLAKYPETLELALTADDIVRIQKSGKIASLIGMEGGHSIDSSLGTLRDMYRLGARYMTLTHNVNLPWADAAAEAPVLKGLSPLGEQILTEMNRLGMLIDISHVSPDVMQAALRVSKAPVMFSHSSARALCDVGRNVPDNILTQLPANGGVVMVTFVPGFISQAVADYSKRETAERARLTALSGSTPAAIDAGIAEWHKTNITPRATVSQVADHIDHIKKIAGIDHIGLGGDFDGIESVVQGLENTSTYPNLIVELLKRNYTDADIHKITNGNILRALRGAEATAKTMKAR